MLEDIIPGRTKWIAETVAKSFNAMTLSGISKG